MRRALVAALSMVALAVGLLSPVTAHAAAVPAPPHPRLVSGDGRVVVTWAAPKGALGYELSVRRRAAGASAWGPASTVAVAGTARALWGTNGGYVQVRVRARSAGGWGSWSDAVVSRFGLPGAPPSVRLRPQPGALIVSWGEAAGAGSPVTAYRIVVQARFDGVWRTWTITDAGRSARSRYVDRVQGATTYRVQVRALNRFGLGAGSPYRTVVTGAAPDRVDTDQYGFARSDAQVGATSSHGTDRLSYDLQDFGDPGSPASPAATSTRGPDGWGSPAVLAEQGWGRSAFAADGTVAALYLDASTSSLAVAVRAPAGPVSRHVLGPRDFGAEVPYLGFDQGGALHVFWTDGRPDSPLVHSLRAADGTWSTGHAPAADGFGATSLALAQRPGTDEWIAVWKAYPRLVWSSSTGGGPWSTPAAVSEESWGSGVIVISSADDNRLRLAATATGWLVAGFGAVATQDGQPAGPSDTHLYAKPFGGNWAALGLSAVTAPSMDDDVVEPMPGGLVCRDGSGCVLLWRREEADGVDQEGFPRVTGYALMARTMSAAGSWSAPVEVARGADWTGAMTGSPVADASSWVVGWSPAFGPLAAVWSRRLTQTGALSSATRWSASADGAGVAMWTTPDGRGRMAWADGASLRVASLS